MNNRKKVIGIIASHINNTDDVYEDYYKFVSAYINKLDNKVISIGLFIDNEEDLSSLDLCDGFIIQGGNKVERIIYCVIDYALKNKKPLLGICLGSEAIANYSNIRDRLDYSRDITLNYINEVYEKLESENDGTLLKKLVKPNIHDNDIHDNNYFHDVIIDKNSIAYDIFKKEKISVPSFHGYDYKFIGKEFKITGRAEDGVSEIIEYKGDTFIMGVHFHPEIIKTDIFNYFIDRC